MKSLKENETPQNVFFFFLSVLNLRSSFTRVASRIEAHTEPKSV